MKKITKLIFHILNSQTAIKLSGVKLYKSISYHKMINVIKYKMLYCKNHFKIYVPNKSYGII